MSDIVKKNAPFFAGFFLFLVAGLILLVNIQKGGVVLFFNDHRSPGTDLFFRYTTRLGEALPYLVAIVYFLFVRFRYAILMPILGIGVSLVSLSTKLFFNHNRPSLYFKELGIFDQINLIEGIKLWERHSFPSGHTMSAFAVYAMLAFLIGGKKTFGVAMLLLAVLVGVSRIYLVQHFMQDVYLGAILGVLIAMVIYVLQERYPYNPNHWIDRSLLSNKKKGLA